MYSSKQSQFKIGVFKVIDQIEQNNIFDTKRIESEEYARDEREIERKRGNKP